MARFRHFLWPLAVTTLVLLIVVGLSACSTPQTTFAPKSDAAERIHAVYILVTVMASLVGAVVLAGLVYALVRFRARPGRVASQFHGNTTLEVLWTIIPTAILVVIGVPSILALVETERDPDEDALHIRVTAHQWWWEFEYEGLGPDGGLLKTANELHLPVGRQVVITIESSDVIHSFWVPQLVGKADAMPGRVSKLEPFTPKEVGVYYGQCAEFCGSAHALMRFRAIVEPLAKFDGWITALQTAPADPTGLAARGRDLFFGVPGCIACHRIAGTIAQGQIGPDLSRFGSRLTMGAGILDNTEENVQDWIYDLRSVKPVADSPRFMPSFGTLPSDDPRRLTREDTTAIAAYLRSMQVE